MFAGVLVLAVFRFIVAFGFVQVGKFGGFRSQSFIRFRHAAVWFCRLGKQLLGGTT